MKKETEMNKEALLEKAEKEEEPKRARKSRRMMGRRWTL